MKRVKILILILAIIMIPRVIYAVDDVPGTPTEPGETNENTDTPTNPDDTQDPDENQGGDQNQNGNQNENQDETQNDNQNQDTQNNTNDNQNGNIENSSLDSTLKSLAISSGTIDFSFSTYNYDVELSSDVSEVKVTATPNDSTATIKYNPSDSVTLKYGETKTISIIVLASDNTSTTYKINFTRKNLEDKVPVSQKNTDLKSLSIEGVTFNFEPDKVSYNITVPNDMEEAIIKYELANSSATVKIDGDTKLKLGKNKIKIIVTSSNGKTNTYTLNVTRSKTRVSVVNDEEQIIEKINSEDKSDLFVNVNIDEEKVISKNILEALSKTNKELSYEILNEDRELLYSIYIKGKEVKNIADFNYQLSFISDNDEKLIELIKSNKYVSLVFKNNTQIPGEMTLKVFIGNRIIKNYEKVDLYKFDGKKLKKVKSNINVEEGYVEIVLDENTEYVLTKLEKVVKTNTSYTIPIVIILTLLVIVAIGLLLKKRKSKVKKVENNNM